MNEKADDVIVWAEPDSPARGMVMVAPAMATPARFYQGFAQWLARQGFVVGVWERTGGDSVAAMKAYDGDLLDWVAEGKDVLDAASERANGLPITWIGHSFGIQVLPFIGADRLARAISIASGSGYAGFVAGYRGKVFAPVTHVLGAVAPRLVGYFPGSTLKIIGDLPTRVARQWFRWCRHPEYMQADIPDERSRFAAVTTPITVLSFSDDELMTLAATNALHERFTGAEVTHHRISPEQVGVERIGHMGFFSRKRAELWERLILPELATAAG